MLALALTLPLPRPPPPAVDCSGRGICDYTTGLCDCFPGYRGTKCDVIDAFNTE